MIKKIGVIGAGQMGNGIAHVCAVAGYPVVLNDISEAQLAKAMTVIEGNLTRQVARGKISEEARDTALGLIQTSTDLKALGDVDLVIEAATEEESLKKKIFQAVCPVLRPDALIATNTSSISVTRLAASTDRPERFMGMHFMNPVPVMQLVELIRGIATEETTFREIRELTIKLGKSPANAEDFPAFIVNRILLP
ncbi:MAG: 3-hydroxyacyl-CoA dehydrogenase NAD-binding domain-containing protein, partial [Ferrovibrionaceae bacterium]